MGVYFGLREVMDDAQYMDKLGLSTGVRGKRFIIQGFGNVGSWAAHVGFPYKWLSCVLSDGATVYP